MAITSQQFVEKYVNSNRYVYGSNINFSVNGTVVATIQWKRGAAVVGAQTGLAIDCTGLLERWNLERGFSIPRLATREMFDLSTGALKPSAKNYYTEISDDKIAVGDVLKFSGSTFGHVAMVSRIVGNDIYVVHSWNSGVEEMVLPDGLSGKFLDKTSGKYLGAMRANSEYGGAQGSAAAALALDRLQQTANISLTQGTSQYTVSKDVKTRTVDYFSLNSSSFSTGLSALGQRPGQSWMPDSSTVEQRVQALLPATTAQLQLLAAKVASIESYKPNLGYDTVNESGKYLGRYQFSWDALSDVGYTRPVAWDSKGNATRFEITQKARDQLGVEKFQDFMKTPEIQDRIFKERLEFLVRTYIVGKGYDKKIGQVHDGILITADGLLAAFCLGSRVRSRL